VVSEPNNTPPRFNTQKFGDTRSTRAAVLVCGFSGKISHFNKPITFLAQQGYRVIAYEYDTTLFSNGDPSRILTLIDDISNDVKCEIASASELVFCGVSLGAFIAFNLQRKALPQKSIGIYGTAGVALSYCIFHARAFRGARTDFEKAGINEISLRNYWASVEILANSAPSNTMPILCANATRDRIVNYQVATATYDTWKRAGYRVITKKVVGIGHVLAIQWYKRNFASLYKLAQSENLL
jgi:esterase/lipase